MTNTFDPPILKRPLTRALALGAIGPIAFFVLFFLYLTLMGVIYGPIVPAGLRWSINLVFGIGSVATVLAGWRLYAKRDLRRHLRIAIITAGALPTLPMAPMLFAGDWWTLLPMTFVFCFFGGLFQLGFRTRARFRRRRLVRRQSVLRERARRRALPFPTHCPSCNYPLAGLPEARCPECGERFSSVCLEE